MTKRILIYVLLAMMTACASKENDKANGHELCTKAVFESIEHRMTTGDSEGHGPDVGSSEWYSVVERRLGIEGSVSNPEKGTKDWCNYVLSKV